MSEVGRRAVVATAVVAAAGATAFAVGHARPTFAAPSAFACGVQREPVKTLGDASGRRLALGHVVPETVAGLRALRVVEGAQTTRGGVVERSVYRVGARILAAKLEEDEDVHLVLADPRTGATLIAELPALACTRGATPRARRLLQRARAAFVRACGTPSAYRFTTYRDARAVVAGVGFFDAIHGQRGVAPNGVELHPVVAFHASVCR